MRNGYSSPSSAPPSSESAGKTASIPDDFLHGVHVASCHLQVRMGSLCRVDGPCFRGVLEKRKLVSV